MNGSLSAVSVCGDKSGPVLFQGNQAHYLDSMQYMPIASSL